MTDGTQGRFDIQAERRMESVEEYQFEPIKGYPMLHWHGKRPFTSTRYYPAQHKETHGSEVDHWRNKIFWGDNLQVMSHLLKEYRGKIKLAYLDPPFDSKADYRKQIKLRGRAVKNDLNSFEEKQYTDIWVNDEYLQYMYERLILVRELLSDTGAVYLHCDWHKSHYLRCIMDEIFGVSGFQNEIVWQRFNFHADAKKFGAVHDTIFFYSKSENYLFEKQYVALSQRYIESHFKADGDGRLYTLDNPTAPGHGKTGRPLYFNGELLHPPEGTMWRFQQDKLNQMLEEGRIEITSTGRPRVKRYLDELQGSAVHTVWTDISSVNSQSNNRTDYPTQKPEALLERIIKASSHPGDIVFDCFMGSGTTQSVAMKLGRRFIGADLNLGAVQITSGRLLQVAEELKPELTAKNAQLALDLKNKERDNNEPNKFFTGFEVYNVNHYDVFRNPVEAKELLIEALELNKLAPGHLFDGEKDGRLWKIMPVNRIATRQDLNELISNLDYRAFSKRYEEHPKQPVERMTLVCMGHEPDLAAILKKEVLPYPIDVEVLDILRDRQDIQFKRDSEARIVAQNGHIVIDTFYPMNLLSKLSLQKERVDDWRELVESIMIDWNYDGAILQPAVVDIPDKNNLVKGKYKIPADAGTIRIKITDLLSESLEQEVRYG